MTEVFAVYSGQACIGFIREADKQCSAFDRDNKPLGVFAKRKEAMAAVTAAAKETGRKAA